MTWGERRLFSCTSPSRARWAELPDHRASDPVAEARSSARSSQLWSRCSRGGVRGAARGRVPISNPCRASRRSSLSASSCHVQRLLGQLLLSDTRRESRSAFTSLRPQTQLALARCWRALRTPPRCICGTYYLAPFRRRARYAREIAIAAGFSKESRSWCTQPACCRQWEVHLPDHLRRTSSPTRLEDHQIPVQGARVVARLGYALHPTSSRPPRAHRLQWVTRAAARRRHPALSAHLGGRHYDLDDRTRLLPHSDLFRRFRSCAACPGAQLDAGYVESSLVSLRRSPLPPRRGSAFDAELGLDKRVGQLCGEGSRSTHSLRGFGRGSGARAAAAIIRRGRSRR